MQTGSWRSLASSAMIDLARFDRLQEPLATRNLALARAIAQAAIDERGNLNIAVIGEIERFLSERIFVIAPELELESLRRDHMVRILQCVQNPEIAKRLQRIALGLHNQPGQLLVQQTLLLPIGDRQGVEDRQARVAVLAAWLTYLRQSVGSCFATAPAIAVQSHHPERFLEDMHQLLAVGSMSRVIDGDEIGVPLLAIWGGGDLWQPQDREALLSPSLGMVRALISAEIMIASDQLNLEKLAPIARAEIAGWLDRHPNSRRVSPADVIRGLLMERLEVSPQQIEQWEKRAATLNLRALEEAELSQASRGDEGRRAARSRRLLELEAAAQLAFKAHADNALLRAWEYALASFAEAKTQFQQWNLATSLGFHSEPGGITQELQRLINQQIDLCNADIATAREKVELIRPQAIYIQGKLQNAQTESEAQWLRAEFYQVKAELDEWERQGQDAHRKGDKLAILCEWFVEKCCEGFNEQFQEVYDPELRAEQPDRSIGDSLNEDRPAGFRLVAKEGRSTVKSWTRVRDGDHFIEVLCRFFAHIETALVSWPEVAEIRREFSRVVTELIQFLRKDEFLKGALARLRSSSRGILESERPPTPWAFVSGGSLSGLLQLYGGSANPLTTMSKWFDDIRDFWVHLIDAVQGLPADLQVKIEKDPEWPMLMNSPDHAFCFKPGLAPFVSSWRERGYPYSWIRDRFEDPVRRFYANLKLTPPQQRDLFESWRESFEGQTGLVLPEIPAPAAGPRTPQELRQKLADHYRILKPAAELLAAFDAHLMLSLPMVETANLRSQLAACYAQLAELNADRGALAAASEQGVLTDSRLAQLQAESRAWLPAQTLWEELLRNWRVEDGLSPRDDLSSLQAAAQARRALAPRPIAFADSNWMREHFAFAINPGTLELEIWCCELWGQRGRPMRSWRPWLDGSHPQRTWNLFPTTARPEFFTKSLSRSQTSQ